VIQNVAEKVASKVPKPNFRAPTTAKNSPIGTFSVKSGYPVAMQNYARVSIAINHKLPKIHCY